MFKACGLDSGASRLRLRPIRAPCLHRASRSFATTLHASRANDPPKWLQRHRREAEFRDPKLPAIEHVNLRDNDLRETLPSFKSIGRDVHLEKEVENARDTFVPNGRDNTVGSWLEDANQHPNVPHGQAGRENEVANDDREEPRLRFPIHRKHGLSELDARLLEPQHFHAKIHPSFLERIIGVQPLMRGMPVYDSTFDAVRSGRNLIIQAPGSDRSLQYLLPVVHGISQDGAWKNMPKNKPGGPRRPSEFLVICPSLNDANEVQDTAARLLKTHDSRSLEIVVMGAPMNSGLHKYKTRGYNILISTPEVLLQWLALPHAKALLTEILQDVKTLVVDGQASSLRRADFLETLGAVMEDIPLRSDTQRMVVSDEHDPQLDGRLASMALPGDYELHREPRLDEVHALREARLEEKQESARARKKRRAHRKMIKELREAHRKRIDEQREAVTLDNEMYRPLRGGLWVVV